MSERKEKFTPGPWVVGESADNGIACVDTGYDYENISPIEICECWGEEDDKATTEISRANAALIASAPDMYAALEELLEFGQNKCGCGSSECTFCRARSALAKARGES
jgi:hypothetical protein